MPIQTFCRLVIGNIYLLISVFSLAQAKNIQSILSVVPCFYAREPVSRHTVSLVNLKQ